MLTERLNELSEKSRSVIPEEVLKKLEKALGELQATHIEEKAIKVGDLLPDFNLVDTTGNKYTKESFKNKKMVFNFFRGSW